MNYTNLAKQVIRDCQYDNIAIIDNPSADGSDELERATEIVKTATRVLFNYIYFDNAKKSFADFETYEADRHSWLVVLMAENAIHRIGTEQQTSHTEGEITRQYSDPASYYVHEMTTIARKGRVK